MTVKLKNNVVSSLRFEVLSSDTTIALPVGHGARFPSLGAGEYFYATIEDAAGNSEIVQATARATDTLTVTRGAEGTVARTFAAGSSIEMRVTAASVLDAASDAAAVVDADLDALSASLGTMAAQDTYNIDASSPPIGDPNMYITGPATGAFGLSLYGGPAGGSFYAYNGDNSSDYIGVGVSPGRSYLDTNADVLEFYVGASTPMFIYGTGGVSIGGVTDPGAGNLSVNGALSLGTDLAITHGGTGASDAATARTNLGAQAAFATTGILTQTGASTFAGRTITGTANQITVTNGDGVSGNPTVAAVVASQAEAEAGSNTTKLMTPQRVSQAIAALAQAVDVQTFTASGNWTKPAGATLVLVRCWGAGGGGGSGQLAASATAKFGGAGGAGGAFFEKLFDASDLSSPVTVTVGAGGTGGASITNTAGNGNAGTAGGQSSFGSLVIAGGGAGGMGGATTGNVGSAGGSAQGGGSTAAGAGSWSTAGGIAVVDSTPAAAAVGYFGGGGSGPGGSNFGARVGANSAYGGAGGGAGAGESSGNVLGTAAAGGVSNATASTGAGLGGAGGASTIAAFAPGSDGTAIGMGGGGGGAIISDGSAGRGGDGGIAGGGGGGGTNRSGSALRSSGRGGNGGNGYVEVFSW